MIFDDPAEMKRTWFVSSHIPILALSDYNFTIFDEVSLEHNFRISFQNAFKSFFTSKTQEFEFNRCTDRIDRTL